ncbi:TrbI/VirB10 family protein [Gluconacetobacter azotocaptans]|uniref:TrbI/VirB10 family protein n=1 Tax=Gluconacetobacter azotocaptans TaxID=142834 RepID=UPI0022306EB7|nr:TrbI/VirB10 family protein [Gluconacetobacter azotocaptans]
MAEGENPDGRHNVPPPPPKADPAQFALRAMPRRVTRLSRRVLVLGVAALAITTTGAIWWALTMHGIQVAGPELYNTDTKPGDAVTGLPAGYAGLTRPPPKPASQPVLPTSITPPPLPGVPVQPDAAAQEQARLKAQAAGAGVFFSVAARRDGAASPAGIPGNGEPHDGESVEPAPGNQDCKEAFLAGRPNTAVYASQTLQTPRSPYEVLAGSVIAAAMVTGLDSDLPGQVIAQVTEDVRDSVTGNTLLIPQGARLLGKYDSAVVYGQQRILLVWTRLIMPDGSSIVLDNQPAADPQGYAGLKDGVDFHTWRLLRGVALATLLNASGSMGTAGAVSGSGNVVVAMRQSGDNAAEQAGSQIVSRDLSVQPTLTVRPGFPVRVIVTRDLILKPYRR